MEHLRRSIIIRATTAACAGILATTLTGCGRDNGEIPLPDCYKSAQFDEKQLVADGYSDDVDEPSGGAETPGNEGTEAPGNEGTEPGTEPTDIPETPTEPAEPELPEQNGPSANPTAYDILQKATLRVLYKSGTSDGRQSSGFFVGGGNTIYAATAAHLFDDNTDLRNVVIIAQDGYTMQPTGGCLMAENQGEQVSPEDIDGGDVDVAVLKINIPEEDRKKHIAALPLAAEPLPDDTWAIVRSFQENPSADGTFFAKTSNANGTGLTAGYQTVGLYNRSQYHVDPGESGSLVASVSNEKLVVQGLVTSASNYRKDSSKIPERSRNTRQGLSKRNGWRRK